MNEITKEEFLKLAPPTGDITSHPEYEFLSFFQHKNMLGTVLQDRKCMHYCYLVLVQDHPGHYRSFDFKGGFSGKEIAIEHLELLFELNDDVDVIPPTFEEVVRVLEDEAAQKEMN